MMNPEIARVYDDKPREACGVFGIRSLEPARVADLAYIALLNLQHRGQDGAGIAVYDDDGFVVQKDTGLVSEVFASGSHISGFPEARIAVGHTRYGTASDGGIFDHVQPIHRKIEGKSIVIAQNGHIEQLAQQHDTTTDTQVLADKIVSRMTEGEDIRAAVRQSLQGMDGAYSLVISDGVQLIGVRDPRGYRPLKYGYGQNGHFFSSEDSAIQNLLNVESIRDVERGEIIAIDDTGVYTDRIESQVQPKRVCGMEFAYFARPDSTIDGLNIQVSRGEMGKCLARNETLDVQSDMVVGVPDSGVAAALGYAEESGVPFVQALTKNRYVTRTFIQATQADRRQAVYLKHHANRELVEGKRLVVIDDSIVRGTTTKSLISMLKEQAGAKEVHLRIVWPPYKWPCYFGMDTGNPAELLASLKSPEEMAEYLGADSLEFLRVEDINDVLASAGGICTACADENYAPS